MKKKFDHKRALIFTVGTTLALSILFSLGWLIAECPKTLGPMVIILWLGILYYLGGTPDQPAKRRKLVPKKIR